MSGNFHRRINDLPKVCAIVAQDATDAMANAELICVNRAATKTKTPAEVIHGRSELFVRIVGLVDVAAVDLAGFDGQVQQRR